MAYKLGDTINLGVGIETVRGTVIAPAIWIKGKSPTGIQQIIEKAEILETSLSGVDSKEAVITKREVLGSYDFNVRSNSLGYFLRSLFGGYVQVDITEGVAPDPIVVIAHKHTFSPTADVLHKSLTLAVAQPIGENYDYPLAIARNLIFKTPIDDIVNATMEFNATKEIIRTVAHTVAFDTTDTIFKHDQTTIKIAADVAGLAAAPALNLESIEVDFANVALSRQYVGNLDVSEILSGNITTTITLIISSDLTADFRAMYRDNTSRVLEIAIIDTTRNIGTTTAIVNPSIKLLFHNVQVSTFAETRTLGEIVKEEIVLKAYNNQITAKSIEVEVINDIIIY